MDRHELIAALNRIIGEVPSARQSHALRGGTMKSCEAEAFARTQGHEKQVNRTCHNLVVAVGPHDLERQVFVLQVVASSNANETKKRALAA
jgi:hypothetical protein